MQSEGKSRIARRDLLRAAAGLTAAGAIVGVPALVLRQTGEGAPASSTAGAWESPLEAGQPLVAYVQDAARGEVVIMAGIDQVVVTDFDLVARLAGAGRV